MDTSPLTTLIITRIDDIDEEHHNIITCVNNVISAVSARADIDLTIDTIISLIRSCERNVITEEEIMKEVRYTNTDTHIKLHKDGITHLNGIIERIRATGEHPDLRVVTTMATWFYEHMRTMDMDLAEEIFRHRNRRHE